MRATVTPNAKVSPLRRPDRIGMSSHSSASSSSTNSSVTPIHNRAQQQLASLAVTPRRTAASTTSTTAGTIRDHTTTVVVTPEKKQAVTPNYIHPTQASRQKHVPRNAKDQKRPSSLDAATTTTTTTTTARPNNSRTKSTRRRPLQSLSMIRANNNNNNSNNNSTADNAHDGADAQPMPMDRPLSPVHTTPTLSSPLIMRTRIMVHLIRHGESWGQLCPPEQRRTDPGLRDCGLTPVGRQQALRLRQQYHQQQHNDEFDMILSSPLTRALETALLVFGDRRRHNTKIVAHYDLREIGTGTIPENQPRPWSMVRDDLQGLLVWRADEDKTPTSGDNGSAHYWNTPTIMDDGHDCPMMEDAQDNDSCWGQTNLLDTQTFAPSAWPDDHDITPRVVRRKQVQDVFRWLYHHYHHDATPTTTTTTTTTTGESTMSLHNNDDTADHAYQTRHVAVVCHYHVIRAALRDDRGFCDPTIQPTNAEPITCLLTTPSGQLVPL